MQREPTKHLLIFRLSGLDCAFLLEDVRELTPMALLSTPPGMPSGLEGFLDLRGRAIPILRLDRLFDLREQRPGLHTPLIILRGPDTDFGVLVESVRNIASVASACCLPLPENHIFHDCATAAVDMDGNPTYILWPSRILLQKERHLLAELQAAAQEHLAHLEKLN